MSPLTHIAFLPTMWTTWLWIWLIELDGLLSSLWAFTFVKRSNLFQFLHVWSLQLLFTAAQLSQDNFFFTNCKVFLYFIFHSGFPLVNTLSLIRSYKAWFFVQCHASIEAVTYVGKIESNKHMLSESNSNAASCKSTQPRLREQGVAKAPSCTCRQFQSGGHSPNPAMPAQLPDASATSHGALSG